MALTQKKPAPVLVFAPKAPAASSETKPALALVPAEPAGPKLALSDLVNKAPEPKVSPAETRRLAIQTEIGRPVQARRLDPGLIRAAMQKGVLVEVSVRRWRGAYRMQWEDLGVTDPKALNCARKNMKPPVASLLPEIIGNALEAAEQQGRAKLLALGIKTPYGRFVPTTKFAEVDAAFEEGKASFFAQLKTLCDNLDTIKQGQRDEFAAWAPQAWLSVREAWEEEGKPAGTFAEQEVPPPSFVAEFVERLVAQIPAAEEIMGTAVYRMDLSYLAREEMQLAVEVATGDASVDQKLQEHFLERKKNLVDDFLYSVRENLVEAVGKLVEKHDDIVTKPLVSNRTLDAILRKIAELRDLNLIGDPDIEGTLSGLSSMIHARREAGSKADSQEVLAALRRAAKDVTDIAKIKAPRLQGL